jgi:hypothetical protein
MALTDGATGLPTMKLFVETCCYALLIADKCSEMEMARQHIDELGIPDYTDLFRDDKDVAEDGHRFFNETGWGGDGPGLVM